MNQEIKSTLYMDVPLKVPYNGRKYTRILIQADLTSQKAAIKFMCNIVAVSKYYQNRSWTIETTMLKGKPKIFKIIL